MKNLTVEQLNEYVKGLEDQAKKAVFETLDFEDLDYVFNYGCSGGVGGLTWFSETHAFFDNYSDEILEMIEELKEEHGTEIFKWVEFNKNNLTWLFVEETVRQMAYDLDLE